jgi:hypothetical protein
VMLMEMVSLIVRGVGRCSEEALKMQTRNQTIDLIDEQKCLGDRNYEKNNSFESDSDFSD